MKRKKMLIISTVALILLAGGVTTFLLVSRGGGGNIPDSPASTVTVWHQFHEGSPERLYLEGLAERHRNDDGGLHVVMQYYDEQELVEKLAATKDSGNAPQLAFVRPQSLPALASGGVLAPLEDREDFATVADSLLANAVDTGKHNGKTYGLPFSVSAQIMVYNPELFLVSSQEPLAAMDDLRQSVEKIGNLDRDIYGIGLAGTDAANIAPLIWSNGGELTDVGHTKAVGALNSTQNIELVQALTDLNGEGSVFIESSAGEALLDTFADGRIGMVVAGPSFLSALVESYPSCPYGTMPVPEGAGGSHSVLDSMLMVVPQSGAPGAGWEYIKIFAGDEIQAGLPSRGIIPAGKAALESTSGSVIAPFILALPSARSLPPISQWPQMDAALAQNMRTAITGGENAGTALNTLAEQWDTIL